jgi:hypothetical protein
MKCSEAAYHKDAPTDEAQSSLQGARSPADQGAMNMSTSVTMYDPARGEDGSSSKPSLTVQPARPALARSNGEGYEIQLAEIEQRTLKEPTQSRAN